MPKRAYQPLAEGALWAISRGADAERKGLVFIPPLIGDTALSQLYRFRSLRREGLSLYSYAYPGHPGAGGRFSILAAAHATRRHLNRAATLARGHGMPLFGLGCCAATIPLLAAVHATVWSPACLVLLNPIVRFAPVTLTHTFWRYGRDCFRTTDEGGRTLTAYLDHLFPGITKNSRRFGALERRRIALARLLIEMLQDRFLEGVRLAEPPSLCCYGETDTLLQHLHPLGAGSYEAAIRSHCSQIVFKPLPAAHFFTTARLRERLRCIICEAFT